MNALSLFANVGVAETYLSDIGLNVVVANELEEEEPDSIVIYIQSAIWYVGTSLT